MTWEYEVFTLEHFFNLDKNLNIQEKLNEYGRDGWELIGVLRKQYPTLGISSKLDSDSIVFKRAIKE